MARIALRAADLNFDGLMIGNSLASSRTLPSLSFLSSDFGHAHLAGDDDAVGGGQRLAGDAHVPGVHAGLLGLAVDQIDDLVGDAVADLVGMAFGNGFGGEEIILPRHGCPLLKDRSAGGRLQAGHVLAMPDGIRQASVCRALATKPARDRPPRPVPAASQRSVGACRPKAPSPVR